MLGQRASRHLGQLPELVEREQRQNEASSEKPPNGPATILPTLRDSREPHKAPEGPRLAQTPSSQPSLLVKEHISPGHRKKVLLSFVLGCSKVDCFQDTAPGRFSRE